MVERAESIYEAEKYQVEEYLLEKVRKVLRGEEKKALIASYLIKQEGEIPLCRMPEEAKIEGEKTPVGDHQWYFAAGRVVYALGFEIHDVVGKLREKLEEQRWPTGGETKEDEEGNQWLEQKAEEIIWLVEPERMRGGLSSLEIEGQYELVMMGTRKVFSREKEEESNWQILVRRKVDE
jgi:hypothetical protein